ncbi:MAG: hypothetical protein K8S00_07240, partial [Bacteroidales bacterium]|nr:hypothetical protein [Bacteroidales bacterium]
MSKKLSIAVFLILIILGAHFVLGQQTYENNIANTQASAELTIAPQANIHGPTLAATSIVEHQTRYYLPSDQVRMHSYGFGLQSPGLRAL